MSPRRHPARPRRRVPHEPEPLRRGAVAVQLAPHPPPLDERPLPRSRQRLLLLLGLLTLAGCAREGLVHGVDERQANEILVALDGAGVAAGKERHGEEGAWTVAVSRSELPRALRVLSEQELPRARPPGFGEVFEEAGMVPSPTEERARYLHALAGELARSLASLDGVLDARVHLALPDPDPLRSDAPPPPRASVLLKARPHARGAVEAMRDGVRALVAGSVAGLEAGTVSVVISEGAPPRAVASGSVAARGRSAAVAGAVLLASVALGLLAWPLRRHLPRWPRR